MRTFIVRLLKMSDKNTAQYKEDKCQHREFLLGVVITLLCILPFVMLLLFHTISHHWFWPS